MFRDVWDKLPVRAARSKRQSRPQSPRHACLYLEPLEDRCVLSALLGQETLVNTATANVQQNADMAVNSTNGSFVVVWESFNQDAANSWGVYAQLYDVNGSKVGAEFRVNSTTAGDQRAPTVAMDPNGNFVVAFESADASGTGVFARKFDVNGNPVSVSGSTNQFQINQTATGTQAAPDIAMETNGDFVVAWHTDQTAGNEIDVYARRYNANGTAIAGEFFVNDDARADDGNQQNPAIAMDADGDFIIAWEDANPPGGYGIFARRFTNAGAGTTTGGWQVNATAAGDQRFPDVAMTTNGEFVITFQGFQDDGATNYGIYARRYSNNTVGQPTTIGGEFRVNNSTTGDQSRGRVSVDANGWYVFAWQSTAQDGSGLGVYVRRYDNTLTAVTNDIQVNWTTTGDQSMPAVLTWNGTFEVAWQGNGIGDDQGVFLAHCGLAGTNTPFQANQTTANAQRAPSVATEDNGDFVVVWVSALQDGSGYGVYGRRYNASAVALGNEFLINQSVASNQTNPHVTMDADGDFVVVWASGTGGTYSIYGRRYSNTGAAVGNEFLIATNPASPEAYDVTAPMVAMNDVAFVVTWARYVDATNGWDIIARPYLISGSSQTGLSEVVVNTTLAGDQKRPTVDMDDSGDVVVTWTHDYAPYLGTGDIHFQRFQLSQGSSGTFRDEFNAVAYNNSNGTQNWSGNVWVESDRSGNAQSPSQGDVRVASNALRLEGGTNPAIVRAQRLANLSALGAASATLTFDFSRNSTEGGDLLIVEVSTDGTNWINLTTIDGAGTEGTFFGQTFDISAYIDVDTQIRFSVDADDNDQFFVDNVQIAYTTSSTFTAQGGNVVVDATAGMQVDSDVDMDSSGNFVVTWTNVAAGTGYGSGAGYDVYARRYNAAGVAQGAAFLVNQVTTGIQVDSRVTLSDSGIILVTWTGGTDNVDGSYGIYTRRYSYASGAGIGNQVLVNTFTSSHQGLAEVAVDAQGDWVIVWNSLGQDGSDYGVYGRRVTNVCGYNLTSGATALALTGSSSSSSLSSGVSAFSATSSSSNGLLGATVDALQRITSLSTSVDVVGGNYLINLFLRPLRNIAFQFTIDDEVIETFNPTTTNQQETFTTATSIRGGRRTFGLRALDNAPLASTLIFDFLELFRLGDAE